LVRDLLRRFDANSACQNGAPFDLSGSRPPGTLESPQTMNAKNSPGKGSQKSTEPMIEAVGLSKFYGPFAACRDISFTVNRGEVVAFLGPNGAGKSTTMKMLTGYLAPSEGVARIAGHNMASDRIAGSVRLGYLPENGPLYPDMTPHSLLEFFADARGMSPEKKQERIEAVVETCMLQTVLHKAIGKLSKGYRQRVGMAQALLHEPDVLILDEPTAGLDPNQIREVRQALTRIGQQKTILLSTHILQEVKAMASRVILINEGRKVFDGSVDELDKSHEGLDEAFHRLTAATT
jgi:ABC-2 type transport system ATP-binding protein